MSQIHPKHCAKKKPLNIKKLVLYSSILLLILLFILLPTKPHFSLKQADVYQLYVSTTHLLIQLTLVFTNPNKRVGIYYDEFQVYASYKAHQITLHSSLAPFYQDHKDTNLVPAVLVANTLPVAPSFNYDLGRDQMAGRLMLNLKADGLLRWKVGTWVSGMYRFSVNCFALLVFGPAPPLTAKQGTHCATTI